MKKLNNSGFLLAETLITTCIIAVLATSLYVYVSKTADNYEKRDNYDNIVDIYTLNNYKLYFESYVKPSTDYNLTNVNFKPDRDKCTEEISSWDMDFMTRFFNSSSNYPTSLIICNGNFKNYIEEKMNEETDANYALKKHISEGFREYIRLLPISDLDSDEYLIIASFKGSQGRKESFASLKTKLPSESNDSDNSDTDDNTEIDDSSDTSGANEPVLARGLIPVVYDNTSENWEVADTTKEWYNYDKQWWANAVTTSEASYRTAPAGTEIPMDSINSMWVWIPRYKYRIPSSIGVGTSSPPEIDVVFESGTETTGSTLSSCPITSTNCYYTHPAFRDGSKVYKSTAYDQGGWNRELEGIWVGKFETGGSTAMPIIKPNIRSAIHLNLMKQFDTSLKFAGGTRNESTGTITFVGNSTYGLTSSTDTHMMKNTEWGAVAYLSQSKYGKMGNPNYSGVNKEIYINNSQNMYTGRSGGSSNATYTSYGSYSYDDKACTNNTCAGNVTTNAGQGASTTGNIYGIYDMSGGAYDRVMANLVRPGFSSVGSSGFPLHGTLPGGNNGSKYYDKYSESNSTNAASSNSIKGDATYETIGWYSDYNSFMNTSNPWIIRGADYNDNTSAGIFNSLRDHGDESYYISWRTVLIP